ncbi:carboxypeptidase-like regulatory domain-containing protein, partial [Phocaeicola dorei]
MKIRMRKRCDIPHSASHFQKSLIIASWLLTFLFTGTAFAQENRTITGIVRDVTGEPLIGASVIQKGTNNGVITDVDGNFNFETIEDAELIVSYIGFRTLKLKTAGENFIHVVLDEDSQLLNDVVVVGYSTNKKVNLSGSVSSLNSEKLASRRVSNVSSALQGMAAGVTVTTQSGEPGGNGGHIRIRGIGTFGGDSAAPLVLVDGVEGTIDEVDPNIIESVSVLK